MQRAALPAGAPEPVASSAADAHEFLPSPLAGISANLEVFKVVVRLTGP
jgi:hypothetical protein